MCRSKIRRPRIVDYKINPLQTMRSDRVLPCYGCYINYDEGLVASHIRSLSIYSNCVTKVLKIEK